MFGAGAAVPSLVAAASGAFGGGVVATDFVEQAVELVRRADTRDHTPHRMYVHPQESGSYPISFK